MIMRHGVSNIRCWNGCLFSKFNNEIFSRCWLNQHQFNLVGIERWRYGWSRQFDDEEWSKCWNRDI